MKWYFSDIGRDITVGGRTYSFTPVGVIGGRMQGILEADGQAEADLDLAVQRRAGVVSIPKDEYDQLLGKADRMGSSRPSSPLSQPRAVEATVGRGPSLSTQKQGVTRAPSETEGLASPSESRDALPEPQDLIRIERVASPELIVKEEDRLATSPEATEKKRRGRKKGE